MVDVATLGGTRVALDAGEISALGAVLRGKLLLPQDHDYSRARRVWNGNIDRYPALIARSTVPADVQQVVNFARNRTLLLSVCGGGHSDNLLSADVVTADGQLRNVSETEHPAPMQQRGPHV